MMVPRGWCTSCESWKDFINVPRHKIRIGIIPSGICDECYREPDDGEH